MVLLFRLSLRSIKLHVRILEQPKGSKTMLAVQDTLNRTVMRNQNLPEVEYLAELVGEFIQFWGFKKIHGKIWLHLYLNEQPMDAAALMAKLNVSKALISISLNGLLDFDVIIEEGLSEGGTRLYVANPNLNSVVNHVLRQREKIMMGKIQAAFSQLKKVSKEEISNNKIVASRIKDLDKFIKNGEKGLNTLMAIL
jgi:DNA-binding transcriptional regulator GbsR (MarR family)